MIPALVLVAGGTLVALLFKRRRPASSSSSSSSILEVVTDTDRRSSLDDLEPGFRADLESVLSTLKARGHTPKVWETERTAARQAWLYASGRTREGNVVTWTEESNHEHGNAADVIDGRPHPDRPGELVGWGSWAEEFGDDATPGDREAAVMAAEFFDELGTVAEAAGLTWGGSWASKDYPHVEAG